MGIRSSQSRPCALPSPLSNGVVNEEGQLRCLRKLGPNLGDSARLLPPSPRSAGRPVPTIVNRPSARPEVLRAATPATRLLCTRLAANRRKLTPRLLPVGPTRIVRSFGLGSDLEFSHLSMSSGRRLVQAVPIESCHLPLPERWTHSGFLHTTLTRPGSLLGEYGAPSGQPMSLWWDPPVHPILLLDPSLASKCLQQNC